MRETQYSEGTQSYTVVTTVQTAADIPLRATVKRDSYDHQSIAFLEAWNAEQLQWSVVHELPYSIWIDAMPSVHAPMNLRKREHAAGQVTADLLGYAERFLCLSE